MKKNVGTCALVLLLPLPRHTPFVILIEILRHPRTLLSLYELHRDFFVDAPPYPRYLLNNFIPISTHLFIYMIVYAKLLVLLLLRPKRRPNSLCHCEDSNLVRPSAKISVVRAYLIEIRQFCTFCLNQCLLI